METGKYQPQIVRRQLEQILSSAGFSRNERLSRFLRFLVEQHLDGRDSELKESLIAIEVFGRKPDYDPKLDAIVRTEALRLRARLSKYYVGEGSGDAVIIELPKGGYTPVFHQRAAPGEKKNRFRWLWLTVVTVLTIALAAASWWWVQDRNAPIRIAVLPLNNLSFDPENDYFVDGLTDEIILNLSVIEGLEVRSQTSSFAFKGTRRNVRAAGKELEADYIVEGSVLRAGQQLRINAQLVRVRDDFLLWSGSFDRHLTDIFTIQDEISLGIVNNLRLKLGHGRRRYETSMDAYDLYLRALSLPPIPSIGPFEQVIAKDPSFAPAYAGLASAYAYRSIQFPVDHPADELPKMRAAAEKTIQLDPLLAEAQDALGLVYARDGQWEQAEKSFRHAIELDRNRSATYADYAYWLLTVVGRLEDARQQLRLAQKSDPLSPAVNMFLADVLISVGRYDEAADYCQKLPENDPFKNSLLGRTRLAQGRTREALQLLAKDWTSPNPLIRGFAGYAYARSGRREEAEKRAAASHYANEQALIFAGLGDKDRTFEALDRMAVLGAQRAGLFLNYPELALLRGDPRLKVFRKKIGLPPIS
jgi:TolB-like protein/Flp pilus assembly protein TadD